MNVQRVTKYSGRRPSVLILKACIYTLKGFRAYDAQNPIFPAGEYSFVRRTFLRRVKAVRGGVFFHDFAIRSQEKRRRGKKKK